MPVSSRARGDKQRELGYAGKLEYPVSIIVYAACFVRDLFLSPAAFFGNLANIQRENGKNKSHGLLASVAFAMSCVAVGALCAALAASSGLYAAAYSPLPDALCAAHTGAHTGAQANLSVNAASGFAAICPSPTGHLAEYPSIPAFLGTATALALSIAALGLPVMAALYHAAVRVSVGDGNAGYGATLKVYAYSSVVALLVWVPYAGAVAIAYGYYLTYVGVREMHGASPSRALTVAGWAALLAGVFALAKFSGADSFAPVWPH